MPEDPGRMTTGHEQYEELCALAAGGLLEPAELVEFHGHLKNCGSCRSDYKEFFRLVTAELPQGQGTFSLKLGEMKAKPLPDALQRFLRRVRAEGVVLSPQVDTAASSDGWTFRPVTLLGPVAALVLVAVSLTAYHFRGLSVAAQASDSATPQVAELKRQNAALTSSLSESTRSLAAQQREIQNLRAQLADAAATAENLRRNNEMAQGEAVRSSSQSAQLLDESRNQEKLLADAKAEAARSSQLRIDTEAALVEQQTRITELSNKLRIANATLEMERQLAATGKDVRELMASRDLHVIDVRDTDANGKPSDAFGRVFLTEGKSLTFYAFDLNAERAENAKRKFQVWAAVAESGKNSSRSLGFLHTDAKAPGRWVLKVDNPDLMKQISAVFVTSEPAIGVKEPTTQKMLYAYLGEPNHP